jgi:hypothetical protein
MSNHLYLIFYQVFLSIEMKAINLVFLSIIIIFFIESGHTWLLQILLGSVCSLDFERIWSGW